MTSNRLASAASAYLRSASHQPIHWFPWSPAAFAAAREQDRPVLLDIGAVWCHWCHVMDGESYEDPGLAAYLNEHFVCIKVDRDERPDVDARYQRAVQAFTRQGGWPLTAFLTPDGEVFFGGTYFPPEGKYGQPGFRSVLSSVLEAYHARRGQVEAQAQAIRKVLDAHLDETTPGEPSARLLAEAQERIASVFDPVNGGFGSQPKFPHPGAVTFLLHRWHDQAEDTTRRIIDRTLEGMARGGMHDQLGGGFHRYSVDAKWIVPHFEKMSYDNSELLKAYLDAYAAFGTEEFADVARGIVRWVREVMSDTEPGYAASQDADVGLEDDGDYFTWTREETAAVLTGDELDVAAAYYDIGTAGEMHHNPGKNVLFVSASLPAVARLTGLSEEAARLLLIGAREKLLAARRLRPTPFVDRTRYTNWNAMMASAMLRASVVLDDAAARDHALRDARRSSPGERRGRCTGPHAGWRERPAGRPGARGRRRARRLRDHWGSDVARVGRADHGAGLAGLLGRRGGRAVRYRSRPGRRIGPAARAGEAGPGYAHAVAERGRGHHPHPPARADRRARDWRERAGALISAFAGGAADLGLYGAAFLLALDWYVNPATHLVVIGAAGDETADAMHRAALAGFAPRRVVQRLTPEEAETGSLPPAIAGMLAAGTGTRGYACVGTSCGLPATTVGGVESAARAVAGRLDCWHTL